MVIVAIAGLCIFKRKRYYAGSTDVRMFELKSNQKPELASVR
jgi:hypothetical protein